MDSMHPFKEKDVMFSSGGWVLSAERVRLFPKPQTSDPFRHAFLSEKDVEDVFIHRVRIVHK